LSNTVLVVVVAALLWDALFASPMKENSLPKPLIGVVTGVTTSTSSPLPLPIP